MQSTPTLQNVTDRSKIYLSLTKQQGQFVKYITSNINSNKGKRENSC